MSFTLRYHPAVRSEDLTLIDRKTKTRIRKAIETRLQTAPHQYGQPLRKTLKGYWKLRVGDYRIVSNRSNPRSGFSVYGIGKRYIRKLA